MRHPNVASLLVFNDQENPIAMKNFKIAQVERKFIAKSAFKINSVVNHDRLQHNSP